MNRIKQNLENYISCVYIPNRYRFENSSSGNRTAKAKNEYATDYNNRIRHT